jgi:hypothetical protein
MPSAVPAAPPVPVGAGTPVPEVPATEITASGFRVRDRKTAAAPARPKPAPVAAAVPARSAEDARSTMSSFMTGVSQGRSDVDEAEPTDQPADPENER